MAIENCANQRCRQEKAIRRCKDCDREIAKGKHRCDLCAYLQAHKKASLRGSGSKYPLFWYISAPCQQCGAMMPRPRNNQPRKWCSNACRQLAKNRAKGVGVVQYWRPPPSSLIDIRSCAHCSSSFVVRSSSTLRYCPTCRARYSPHVIERLSGREKECIVCGVLFSVLPLLGNRRAICSSECQLRNEARHNRVYKSARRDKTRGGDRFDPFDVFERDGWRCVHCGTRTPVGKRGSYDDNAPELDHIVPLSKGGRHTRRNAQLLCRRCNIAKRDGALYDQTLLFG